MFGEVVGRAAETRNEITGASAKETFSEFRHDGGAVFGGFFSSPGAI